jgi:DNA-binding CsgD family transcriptional regulator
MNELSDQDRNVLRLVVDGKSSQQIAEKLHIQHGAVRYHIRRLKDYYGVETRTELIHQFLHQPRRQTPTLSELWRHEHKERP